MWNKNAEGVKIILEKEILENHKLYLERKALYKSFDFDIDKERDFVIEKAQPIYGDILEAGTGKGHFALSLAKAGYNFTTFDISETEQAFAKLNLKYFGLETKAVFRIENGENLSFKDKSFDIIFAVNLMHHLMNPYKVVDEFMRVLSFEGKIIISDFTKEGLETIDKIHAFDGKTHEVGKTTLSDIESYLAGKGLRTKQHKSRFQEVLIIYRQTI
jgi:ubiquinone/menaquinone biosynthesis C-methylase UbiE